ncbi:carboxylate-amine ligase [Actinocrinis puniceicyclus]|uniref:carboxylate-amine ligase n=1 Tax=Actinocrinis puniceicyclus TaxID=977794 RepID=UPI0028AC774F|nr:glutamate--cysteine ligase [Actinocrinis puniceicyclus]
MITLGVEEEYLLLDPVSGHPVAAADAVCKAAGLQPALAAAEVQHELLLAQLEVATPVCESLNEVGGHLLRLRHALGEAAQQSGCLLAATAAAPFSDAGPAVITDTPRYQVMYRDAQQLVEEQLINGMHVHVGIPDRDTGVVMLNRLRPWLPVLVALSGNSPFWRGRDTGFASWRTVVFGRWPVSGPPPVFADGADYERRVRALVDGGAVRDAHQMYWHARLSERYRTLEVRAADVQLRVEQAVMIAGLVRGLAQTAVWEHEAGGPLPSPLPEVTAASSWHAARHGLDGSLISPEGKPVDARSAARGLLRHVSPALAAHGDGEQVAALLEQTLRDGNGSRRQRDAVAGNGLPELVRFIAAETTKDAHARG